MDTLPPVPLPELVGEPPSSDASWVDGSWHWRSGAWLWEPGGWLEVPRGVKISLWKIGYLPDGRYVYAPTSWYAADGQLIAPPKYLRRAQTEPGGGEAR